MQNYYIGGSILLVAVLWQVGFLHSLFATLWNCFVALLGIFSGVMLYLLSGKQRNPATPKLPKKVGTVSRFLAKLTLSQTRKPRVRTSTVAKKSLWRNLFFMAFWMIVDSLRESEADFHVRHTLLTMQEFVQSRYNSISNTCATLRMIAWHQWAHRASRQWQKTLFSTQSEEWKYGTLV